MLGAEITVDGGHTGRRQSIDKCHGRYVRFGQAFGGHTNRVSRGGHGLMKMPSSLSI